MTIELDFFAVFQSFVIFDDVALVEGVEDFLFVIVDEFVCFDSD